MTATPTKAAPKLVSLASLDARAASAVAMPFEYITPAGDPTGIILHLLGGQSKIVQDEANKAINERRRKEAMVAAQAKTSRNTDDYVTVETDVAFGQRLAAIRLTGWEGIEETWSAELGLLLCQNNNDVAAFILAKSNDMANFMKASSRTS